MSAELVKGTLTGTIDRTASVRSFRFRLEKAVDFIPGQFSQVLFDPGNISNKELNKYLSFSCAPGKGYIEVTKRLSASAFSDRLRALKPGDEVVFKTPMGNCVYKDEYKKIGFLIGGIGITPVISIIEYIVERGLDTDILLCYSNRNEEEIAFKSELDGWQARIKRLKIIYAVTDCPPKDNRCFFGRIDKGLLLKSAGDVKERILYIFGPPVMVEAMKTLCADCGFKKENIRIETFVGY